MAVVQTTSVGVYRMFIKIWKVLGISPLDAVLVTHSKSKALHERRSRSRNAKVSDRKSSLAVVDQIGVGKEEQLTNYPIIVYENFYNIMFVGMLCFFYLQMFYAMTKFVLAIKSKKEEKLDNAGGPDTPLLVGTFVWTVYCCTCCAVYFVHFFKTEELSEMFIKWQIIEGDILTESRAMKASGRTLESFVTNQKRAMALFMFAILISIVCMTLATTQSKDFPIYIYSNIPEEWEQGRPWISQLCFVFSLLQVTFLLLCESQSELIAIAFTRSLLQCLQILNQPAIDFHTEYLGMKNDYDVPYSPFSIQTPRSSLQYPKEIETLEIFHDSVNRYEKLNSLMVLWNNIFRWPLCIRKAFTTVKICCYVYLLLKHPLHSKGLSETIIFLYASIAIIIKFGLILSTMGGVRIESERFLVEWKRVLLLMFPKMKVEEERKLECCQPFGFRVGNFYTIKSQTFLTFGSVVMTYLIILLQLQF